MQFMGEGAFCSIGHRRADGEWQQSVSLRCPFADEVGANSPFLPSFLPCKQANISCMRCRCWAPFGVPAEFIVVSSKRTRAALSTALIRYCDYDGSRAKRSDKFMQYRVDGVYDAQETERNKATAKYVAWPSCAWLLLSFFLFPVRHPLCIKCHSEPIWLQTKTIAISNKSQYPMVLISDKHCTPQRIPRPSNIITLAGGSVKLQSATDSLRSIHLLLLREISFSSFFKGTTYTNNEWRD